MLLIKYILILIAICVNKQYFNICILILISYGLILIRNLIFPEGRMKKIEGMRDIWGKGITAIFVNSIWLHRFWGCHRLPGRSFFIHGRQFHVCARCTGILLGIPVSFALLPLRKWCPTFFIFSISIMMLDGLSQYLQWRESNNALRFFTGISTSSTFIPTLFYIGGI